MTLANWGVVSCFFSRAQRNTGRYFSMCALYQPVSGGAHVLGRFILSAALADILLSFVLRSRIELGRALDLISLADYPATWILAELSDSLLAGEFGRYPLIGTRVKRKRHPVQVVHVPHGTLCHISWAKISAPVYPYRLGQLIEGRSRMACFVTSSSGIRQRAS